MYRKFTITLPGKVFKLYSEAAEFMAENVRDDFITEDVLSDILIHTKDIFGEFVCGGIHDDLEFYFERLHYGEIRTYIDFIARYPNIY